jgi:hypothetical protein
MENRTYAPAFKKQLKIIESALCVTPGNILKGIEDWGGRDRPNLQFL